MATRSSADVGFLLIGGRSVLSAPLTEVSEMRSRVLEQIDGLGDADDKWGDVGQEIFELTQEGFYNSGLGTLHEALEAADPQVLMYAPVGNVIGRDFVGISAARTIYDRLPARGVHHKAKATYKPAAGPEHIARSLTMDDSKISADLVARTALGPVNLGITDWGANSTNGAALYLGVSNLNLDGGTNLTVTIRHSTDNFGASDVLLDTFTVVTAHPASERRLVAGTINRYTRTTYVFNGGSGVNRTATFATGIGRR